MRACPTSRGQARFVAFLIGAGKRIRRRAAHAQEPPGIRCNIGKPRGSQRDPQGTSPLSGCGRSPPWPRRKRKQPGWGRNPSSAPVSPARGTGRLACRKIPLAPNTPSGKNPRAPSPKRPCRRQAASPHDHSAPLAERARQRRLPYSLLIQPFRPHHRKSHQPLLYVLAGDRRCLQIRQSASKGKNCCALKSSSHARTPHAGAHGGNAGGEIFQDWARACKSGLRT